MWPAARMGTPRRGVAGEAARMVGEVERLLMRYRAGPWASGKQR